MTFLTNSAVAQSIGKCSYGAYIFHVAVITAIAPLVGDIGPVYKRILLFVIAYVLTVTLAHISYHGFEKRIIAYANFKAVKERDHSRSRRSRLRHNPNPPAASDFDAQILYV